jgi:hypothetical protein
MNERNTNVFTITNDSVSLYNFYGSVHYPLLYSNGSPIKNEIYFNLQVPEAVK